MPGGRVVRARKVPKEKVTANTAKGKGFQTAATKETDIDGTNGDRCQRTRIDGKSIYLMGK
jgi:hypothetical protein